MGDTGPEGWRDDIFQVTYVPDLRLLILGNGAGTRVEGLSGLGLRDSLGASDRRAGRLDTRDARPQGACDTRPVTDRVGASVLGRLVASGCIRTGATSLAEIAMSLQAVRARARPCRTTSLRGGRSTE